MWTVERAPWKGPDAWNVRNNNRVVVTLFSEELANETARVQNERESNGETSKTPSQDL